MKVVRKKEIYCARKKLILPENVFVKRARF